MADGRPPAPAPSLVSSFSSVPPARRGDDGGGAAEAAEAVEAGGRVRVRSGDLLEAREDAIVQQNNCISLRAHGLSAFIARRWPSADPYALRAPGRSARGGFWPNTAAPEARPAMGTSLLLETKERGRPRVACLFAQYCPGPPGRYRDPAGLGVPDAAEDRLRAFGAALRHLAAAHPELRSLALPHGIGCGLAEGDWSAYSAAIEAFAREHPHLRVVIYDNRP